MNLCVSCADPLQQPTSEDTPEVQDAMKARCRVCAKEVLGIEIPKVGTLQNDCGGGRRVIRETKTH